MTLQVTQAATTEILRLFKSRQADLNAMGAKGRDSFEADVTQAEPAPHPVQAKLDFVPGGCAEQRYQLNFNQEPSASPSSQAIDCGTVELHVSTEAWPHVQQLTIDYVEDLMGGSFRFDNPELPQTCHCGQSFRFGSST